MKVGVAAIGDVLDINCWSNIPYYFFQSGKSIGIFDEPWSLDLKNLSVNRRWWNLKQVVLGRGRGGYQYSSTFLKKAESQIPAKFFASRVISFNQVFPRASSVVNAGGKMYYYIDTTLADLFREESYAMTLPDQMKANAIAQEKENYEKADAVITMGSWVHDSLLKDYGIVPQKIFQVLPGANITLPSTFAFPIFSYGAGIDRDLILGFVGKDWKRKGLLFLLGIRDELFSRGYKVKIKVAGNCPEGLKNHAGIEYTGFIDKQNQSEQFVNVITSCDIGCLFSKSEALGISTLEFLRMGVPVAGFSHQGLKDTLLEGASLRFPIGATSKEVADEFEKLILSPALLLSLKDKAKSYAPLLDWSETVSKIKPIIL